MVGLGSESFQSPTTTVRDFLAKPRDVAERAAMGVLDGWAAGK
jgi:hypothetical protein